MFEAYTIDEDAEKKGKWFELKRGGGKIKVARAGNADFQAAYAKLVAPLEEKIAKLSGDEDNLEALKETITARDTALLAVIAETLLKDWKPAKGKAPKYTPEAGAAQLKKSPLLGGEVMAIANNLDLFMLSAREDAEKN